MKKKIAVFMLLSAIVFGSAGSITADEFGYSTAYDVYEGGYAVSSMSHWTHYRVRGGGTITVGAGIKVMNNPTEVATGIDTATIYSMHKVGPYESHSHYKYVY